MKNRFKTSHPPAFVIELIPGISVKILFLLVCLLTGCGKPTATVQPIGTSEELASVEQAAEAGDSNAQYRLGQALAVGNEALGLRSNRKVAAGWFRKAAEGGIFEADLALGRLRFRDYRYRVSEPVDPDRVLAHFESEAARGSPEAQALLAFAYSGIAGTDADGSKAIRYALMAAESDPKDTFPMFTVAKVYRDGKIVPTDPGKAFYWMKRASDLGYQWAQLRLAEMYAEGIGTERNLKAALDLARKADAGGADAAKKAVENYERAVGEGGSH